MNPDNDAPQGAQGGAPPATQNNAPPATAGEVAPSGNKSKTVTMPSYEVTKIKKAAAEKGRAAAMAELDAEAKALGFKDHADLKAQAQAARARVATPARDEEEPEDEEEAEAAPPARKQQPAPKPQNGGKVPSKLEKELQRLREDKTRANNLRVKAEKEAKAARDEALRMQAESELRMAAASVGIKDYDYAVDLCKKHIASLGDDPKKLEAFNETEYFESLRTTKPYLFGVHTAPAHTNSETAAPARDNNGAAGPAPKPGVSAPPDKKFDARKATKAEVDAHWEKIRRMSNNVTS